MWRKRSGPVASVRRRTPPKKSAPLVNITTSRPLELLCMDFLSLEPDSSNTGDIFVLTDHFTKFAVALPTPNQKAKTVAKYLWDNFIIYYGIPERIQTDQGTDFESKLIKELYEVAGSKSKWKDYVKPLVHTYNCTKTHMVIPHMS